MHLEFPELRAGAKAGCFPARLHIGAQICKRTHSSYEFTNDGAGPGNALSNEKFNTVDLARLPDRNVRSAGPYYLF